MTKLFISNIHSNNNNIRVFTNYTSLSEYLTQLAVNFKVLQQAVLDNESDLDTIKQIEKNIKKITLENSPVFEKAEFKETELGAGYLSEEDISQSAWKKADAQLYAQFLRESHITDAYGEIDTHGHGRFKKLGQLFQGYRELNRATSKNFMENNLRNAYLERAKYLVSTAISLHAEKFKQEFLVTRGLSSEIKNEIGRKLSPFFTQTGFLSYISFFSQSNVFGETAQVIDFMRISENFLTTVEKSVHSIYQHMNHVDVLNSNHNNIPLLQLN